MKALDPHTPKLLLIAEALATCAEQLVQVAVELEEKEKQNRADEVIDLMRDK